jgi:hypothetical protein
MEGVYHRGEAGCGREGRGVIAVGSAVILAAGRRMPAGLKPQELT